ncbi:hypothetical protein AJ80_08277 [Polytolypa hystricis UAMH7299]|uniref:Uncharacterized protein n=1 Tax=Polytolypa hystricis (strain UAMH7299) TaxID=1447883 RepID=A0A2B7XAB0_POLH7|nr:hypothetical protein AJ80_08277 [Polytolypa hystricis UAMH7299]
MTERPSRPPSILLEPPAKGVELQDPGAHVSDSEDDHFSDASEGRLPSRPRSRAQSPVPKTRVEKIDDAPSYGEIPGSPAYEKRELDAVPDEVEIIGDRAPSRPLSTSQSPNTPLSPGGTSIPRMVVEKVDPSETSYGEEPGTPAYELHKADAAPDVILRVGESDCKSPESPPESSRNSPIPETLLSRVESLPEEDAPRPFIAHKRRPSDALPDVVETVPDAPGRHLTSSPIFYILQGRLTEPGSPISWPDRSDSGSLTQPESQLTANDAVSDEDTAAQNEMDEAQFGDDFDDFEGGGDDAGEDDFGDFDEAFQQPTEDAVVDIAQDQTASLPNQSPPPPSFVSSLSSINIYPYRSDPAESIPISPIVLLAAPLKETVKLMNLDFITTQPPLVDFDNLSSLSDFITATSERLDSLFPNSANLSSLPPADPIPDSSSIFITERSLSLWSQLVAPPPLQPPNWVKSRIRRLFLISLGVPVDLDEILPASKQKKLVLPSINFDKPSSRSTPSGGEAGGGGNGGSSTTTTLGPDRAAKSKTQSRSSTSFDSRRSSASRTRNSRRRGARPPPELDLSAVRRLCATTDAALDGFTDEEMQAHIVMLQDMTVRASEVLEYWLKRRDGQLGEKEAFEGVIENLVKHARQVRK